MLLAAAGTGERIGGEPKQFRLIGGVPMLLRAVRPFAQHPRVEQLVVALPAATVHSPPAWLESIVGARLQLVSGGATRAESVKVALDALDPACEIVLVHDAARPFVSPETVDNVIQIAGETGAVPAVPVTDTLKRVDRVTGEVTQTVDREGLWRAQTPQGFPRAMLERAYATVGADACSGFTDEAALFEAAGYRVRLVRDSVRNIKITTAHDFEVAEVLARS
ncbi:MAG: 2-C-methyl-D-erythritol 4-phosphate cytidylyltransferase [Gemmatimonadota bacterium]|nr:MAG: 2-C-methyl-D-erythritol 4-phosphate cytidylyltransferase [Gemmatimonadota bacterium]